VVQNFEMLSLHILLKLICLAYVLKKNIQEVFGIYICSEMPMYSLFLEMLAKPWTKIHVSQYCANLFNKFHQICVGGCEITSHTNKKTKSA
jgi:hypothetical protein